MSHLTFSDLITLFRNRKHIDVIRFPDTVVLSDTRFEHEQLELDFDKETLMQYLPVLWEILPMDLGETNLDPDNLRDQNSRCFLPSGIA